MGKIHFEHSERNLLLAENRQRELIDASIFMNTQLGIYLPMTRLRYGFCQ